MFCRGRYKNSGDWLIDWLVNIKRTRRASNTHNIGWLNCKSSAQNANNTIRTAAHQATKLESTDSTLTSCAGGRRNMPPPLQVDLWPFDLESGVRVTCDLGYLCANFSLPRPLCSRLRPNVRDRQTDVRQTTSDTHHRLMPPTLGAGHNKTTNVTIRTGPLYVSYTVDSLRKLMRNDCIAWLTMCSKQITRHIGNVAVIAASTDYLETKLTTKFGIPPVMLIRTGHARTRTKPTRTRTMTRTRLARTRTRTRTWLTRTGQGQGLKFGP